MNKLFLTLTIILLSLNFSYALNVQDVTQANSDLQNYNQQLNGFTGLQRNGNGSFMNANDGRNYMLLVNQMSGQASNITAFYQNTASEGAYAQNCNSFSNQDISSITLKLNNNLSQSRLMLGSDNDMVIAYQNLINVLYQYNRICQDQKVMDDTKAKMDNIQQQFSGGQNNSIQQNNNDPKIISNGYIRGTTLYCDYGYSKNAVNYSCVKDQTVSNCVNVNGTRVPATSPDAKSCTCDTLAGYAWAGGEKCVKNTPDTVNNPVTTTIQNQPQSIAPLVEHITAPSLQKPVVKKYFNLPKLEKSTTTENTATVTVNTEIASITKVEEKTTFFGAIKNFLINWFK